MRGKTAVLISIMLFYCVSAISILYRNDIISSSIGHYGNKSFRKVRETDQIMPASGYIISLLVLE
ncbi:hypothetical protein [Terribacillus sp. 7520-G]|uniref:hypothetical protein n=1 Tax=Terribacillus TaxID=459532 RepID=UPI000BA61D9D|nr:hypothetical protein [Terribacillus sp. 7520-G]PAD40494.1 hypothetical protein CHH53_00635 [Terribacillus sp. 7520-G]